MKNKKLINNFGTMYSKWTDSLTLVTKGQIISECPYEITVWTKIPTKKFPRFLP